MRSRATSPRFGSTLAPGRSVGGTPPGSWPIGSRSPALSGLLPSPQSRSADRLPSTGEVSIPPATARYVRSPAAGAPMLTSPPAGTSSTPPRVPGPAGRSGPVAIVTSAGAPVAAITAPAGNRNAARPRVSSIPAAPSLLPTRRLPRTRLAASAAPDGGTAKDPSPSRPRSCTVASGPGRITSTARSKVPVLSARPE